MNCFTTWFGNYHSYCTYSVSCGVVEFSLPPEISKTCLFHNILLVKLRKRHAFVAKAFPSFIEMSEKNTRPKIETYEPIAIKRFITFL